MTQVALIDVKTKEVLKLYPVDPDREFYNIVVINKAGEQEGSWRSVGWGDDNYSLVSVDDPVAEDGKQIVDVSYTVSKTGEVQAVATMEDIPPPPPPLTAEQRITIAMKRLGISLPELRDALKELT